MPMHVLSECNNTNNLTHASLPSTYLPAYLPACVQAGIVGWTATSEEVAAALAAAAAAV